VLPLLGALIATILPMPPDLAVGTDCGGGVSRAVLHQNLITLPGKGRCGPVGDLTASISVITFTIPILINLALQTFLGTGRHRPCRRLDHAAMSLITLLPIAIGMAIRARLFSSRTSASRSTWPACFGIAQP